MAKDSLDKELITDDGNSKVIELTNTGERELFDITVDSVEHEYLANGIASHNCVCLDEAAFIYKLDEIL